MQSLFIHRVVTTAVMPLVAAGGYYGYSYNQPPAPIPAPACISITSDLYPGTGNSTEVLSLQRFLIDRGYLRGTPNGSFEQATGQALARFQSDNGLPTRGYIDAETRALISQMTCGDSYGYGGGSGQLSVQGLDAPAQLSVGQPGTWTVRMSGTPYYQSGALHYQVVWGDENTGGRYASSYAPNAYAQASGSFTHTYRAPGTYTPTFVVSDDQGHSVRASASVQVYATAYAYPTQRPSYPNPGYYTPPTSGPYGSIPSGCTGYYDRSCYVNGTYIGPNASGSYVYNGPGDTCYYFNGQWQGNCSGSSFNYPYGSTVPTANGNYGNTYGGPSGVDYSCYYDRACLARLNGTPY